MKLIYNVNCYYWKVIGGMSRINYYNEVNFFNIIIIMELIGAHVEKCDVWNNKV